MDTDFLPFVRKTRKVAKPKKGDKKKVQKPDKKPVKKAPTAATSAAAGVPTAAELDALLATKSYINGAHMFCLGFRI